jgi:hypothetical protein
MQGFARANLVLVVLWIAVAFLLIREYKAKSSSSKGR